ncbi:ABC transporter substrate-binding protein [Candidatus Leptofilum sp.]|uniref:ABC transporter substrate-binding protein n=1 Tax=Candidatus Leptofilum sp. TaxID=3241576 RepID=UPI003B5B0B9A
MSDRFDWQIGEEEDELPPAPDTAVSRNAFPWFWLALIVVVLGAVFGLWRSAQTQLADAEENAVRWAQDALDFEREAYLGGDGDLFFSFQANDSDWFSAQLMPLNGRLYHHDPVITHAEQHEDHIWANLQWREGTDTYQRVGFWQIQPDGSLIRQPDAPGYWGSLTFTDYAWGRLRYTQTDTDLAEQIGDQITERILTLCVANCPTAERPFTITIAPHFQETGAADELTFPSPRLVGLDENGAPSELFWELVDGRITDRFGQVTLRFGIPEADYPMMAYQMVAAQFMAQNPRITIELIPLRFSKPTPNDLATLDIIGTRPTAEFLAAGAVRDLTTMMQTDPDFDRADFYEQVWQGAWWQDRMWFMPLAARMNVIFYDKSAYRVAEQPEPTLRWTWEEMEADMTAVSFGPDSQNGLLEWGFLDVGPDVLFSYAYNWNNSCEEATVRCDQPLTPESVAATLRWYNALAGQPGQLPDFTQMNDMERAGILSNWQSARRRAVIWVDSPLLYELRVQMDPMGVVPFPGSNRFDGIAPLWVDGGFITSGSERSYAAWEWLKFLANQPPSARFRFVPARPSVATSSQFWGRLPHDLGNAMRSAFPFSRPVLIEEQHLFSWEMLTAVQTNTPPEQAARLRPRLHWFQQ